MRRILKSIYRTLVMAGFDPIKFGRALKGLPFYWRDFRMFRAQQKDSDVKFKAGGLWPCLGDRFSSGGVAKGHYFHQDLLVARRIFSRNPQKHVDVGSRIDGFVAHVASFRQIDVYDIREIESNVPNISFTRCDLMHFNDMSLVESCDSLSCLHALEHFGLGRYGDTVGYTGYIEGLGNLFKILRKGGVLYLSVPIGPQRVEFNAHRVFSLEYITSLFENKFQVLAFSYVDDQGDLYENFELRDGLNDNFGCIYGCGIFELEKIG